MSIIRNDSKINVVSINWQSGNAGLVLTFHSWKTLFTNTYLENGLGHLWRLTSYRYSLIEGTNDIENYSEKLWSAVRWANTFQYRSLFNMKLRIPGMTTLIIFGSIKMATANSSPWAKEVGLMQTSKPVIELKLQLNNIHFARCLCTGLSCLQEKAQFG